MFVIKFKNNETYGYWTGYNRIDIQLRKAVIYNSLKMAISTAEDCLKRKSCFSNQPDLTYEIVEVELFEKKAVYKPE